MEQMGGKISDPYGFDWQDPYWICFFALALAIAIHCCANAINDSCEYIFDEQDPLGPRAVVMWQLAKKSVDQEISRFLGSPPSFKDDKKVLPLQAADLYAWHVRKVIERTLEFKDTYHAIIDRMKIVPEISFIIDRNRLLKLMGAFTTPVFSEWAGCYV